MKRWLIATAMAAGALLAPLSTAPLAHADMCSPGSGVLGFLWPAVKMCQPPGAFWNVPVVSPPATVPEPVRLPLVSLQP